MQIIGLTGSIAMGKSTAASYLAERGIPLFSADAVVHELYAGAAAPLIEAAFPGTVADGVVDRERLSRQLLADPEGFRRLEAIVHPLVRARRERFIEDNRQKGVPLVVLDIPLLYEKHMEGEVDAVLLVTAPAEVQRERALRRPGMTAEKLALILSRQVPDAEKRLRADFVVDTSGPLAETRRKLDRVLESLQDGCR
jgi:dephospho-CoA kinase